jgi:hydrogenase expression/formation protein HypE
MTTGIQCPIPDSGKSELVQLSHGEGGRLMRELLDRHVLPPLMNDILAQSGDAAVLPAVEGRIVMTTDSYVVSPLTFPGGDIGTLAVFGTCNDLAVAGARPKWISLGLIVEEGFSLSELDAILASLARAADQAGVQVVTGDTKVVPRGTADGLFINTTGVGELCFAVPGPSRLQVGDAILVSGPIGSHGVAVLSARERLDFDPCPQSDCGLLFPAVDALRSAGVPVRAMRDATRGGLSAVLHEWTDACGHSILLEGERIPVSSEVNGVCELLGLEPLHIACEGTMAVAVPADCCPRALAVLGRIPISRSAVQVGAVAARQASPVVIRRSLGQLVPVDEPLGAPLPRIC